MSMSAKYIVIIDLLKIKRKIADAINFSILHKIKVNKHAIYINIINAKDEFYKYGCQRLKYW